MLKKQFTKECNNDDDDESGSTASITHQGETLDPLMAHETPS